MTVKLVEVLRSDIVESVHRGDIGIVSSSGDILYSLGDTDRVTFMRSSSKPFQTLAGLETGMAEKFGLDLKEIALTVSSHSGENEHIEVLQQILHKIGTNEEALRCGIHEPVNKEAAREILAAGKSPTKLHCNCSAKHATMIAASKIMGASIEDYDSLGHPVQMAIEKVLSDFSGIDTVDIGRGLDGCGAPVYAIPLKNIALAYANLTNKSFMDGKYLKSQNYIISAMTIHPEMVAGNGRLDTELMRAFGDRFLGKIGAEGVYCASLIGKNIGIAIKIDDGNSRAVGPVIMEILLQMKVISKEDAERIKDFWNPRVLNHRGDKVGEVRAVFRL